MTTIYSNELFDGKQFRHRQCITVTNGVITAIKSGAAQDAEFAIDGLLVPGFIDVQVNGGGGVLFNNQPCVETLRTMANAHQRFGTTAMLATLITDSYQTMVRAADAIAQAIHEQLPGIIGVHFEGPHLSAAKKGIHPKKHIRGISDDELAILLRQDLGIVCVTLAPENVDSQIISTLRDAGVIVCLGHSNANAQQVDAALQAGASGFTHLYNAMSPLTSRETGMVGMALLDNNSYCGLIVDHHHVSKQSCQLAVKCKGVDKIMLVTDAMSHVGSDQEVLEFAGMTITKQDDKLTIEQGNLAGSTLDMASAVRHCVNDLGLALPDALKMAALTPANFISQQAKMGKIALGQRANWVALDEQLHVSATYVQGQCVYNRSASTNQQK